MKHPMPKQPKKVIKTIGSAVSGSGKTYKQVLDALFTYATSTEAQNNATSLYLRVAGTSFYKADNVSSTSTRFVNTTINSGGFNSYAFECTNGSSTRKRWAGSSVIDESSSSAGNFNYEIVYEAYE